MKEFEDVAFALPEGGVSEVFETAFGVHIVKVELIRYSERRARHILIRPEVVSADRLRVRALAAEVAGKAATEDFRSLVEQYHDSAEPDSGTIAQAQIRTRLALAYTAPLSSAEPGEIAGPIQFVTQTGLDAFAIVRIIARTPEGEYDFEEFEPQLRERLGEQKRIRAHIDGLRATTYIALKDY